MNFFDSIYISPVRFCMVQIVLAGLLICPTAIAQKEPQTVSQSCPAPPTQPTPEKIQALFKVAKDRGFLWKFEKNGRTGFLYGTVHINKLEWSFPGPKTIAAIRDSDLIAFELDVLDPQIQAQMSNPAISGIKNVPLPQPLKQRMEAVARRVCAPLEALAAMHPIMQMVTVTLLDARFAQFEIGYGSEIFMAGFARGAKKTTTSLETAELQMRALFAGDADEVIASVESGLTLFESGRQREQTARLLSVWATSNFTDLQQYEKWCECATTDADRRFLKRINDDRNTGLAASIDKLHHEGRRVFAAIGALHMVGPNAVPKLLADMGHKVERVAFESSTAVVETKAE